EIESKILDIVKQQKNAAESTRLAREAAKNDPVLRDLLEKRKTYTEAEKAVRGVFEPKPETSAQATRTAQDAEAIREMREVFKDLAAWFKAEFGKNLPFRFGQNKFETKLGYDHRAAGDVSINPLSKEGQAILQYLDEQGVSYRASTGREVSKTTGKLISSGPHIHVGALSRGIDRHEKLVSGAQLGRDYAEQQDRLATANRVELNKRARALQELPQPDLSQLAALP